MTKYLQVGFHCEKTSGKDGHRPPATAVDGLESIVDAWRRK